MNTATEFYQGLQASIKSMIDKVSPFRAKAHAIVDGKVQIQQIGSSTPLSEPYAKLAGADVEAGDEVAVIIMNGKPFVLGRVVRDAAGDTSNGDFSTPVVIEVTDAEAFAVADASGVRVLNVDSLGSTQVSVMNGAFLRGFASSSLAGTGTYSLDASSGAARFDGNVTVGGNLAVSGALSGAIIDTVGYYEEYVQAAADVTSTTSTTTFQTALTRTFTLPTGVWKIIAVGEMQLNHSASGGVATRVTIAGDNGAAVVNGQYTAAYSRNAVRHSVTGLSGSVTALVEYRSSVAGTSTCRNPSMRIIGVRTA